MMVAGALTTQAENYAYFVIEQNNGTSLSMPAVGLNISYSDGNLVATNGTAAAGCRRERNPLVGSISSRKETLLLKRL